LKTLKICIISGTLREITQRETAVSSLIDTRIFLDQYTRKGNKRDKKEDDQKKERITMKTRDFSNQREQ
jgi:hypothetical protein